MSAASSVVTLANGRRLDVLTGGDPAGIPVVVHHGTPSDATVFASWSAPLAARGARLVGVSRPGYAGSDRRRGRSVADHAADVAVVLAALGAADGFFTLGWSGGGPHALACAALLPGCRGAAILAGVAAWEMGRDRFLDRMGPENVDEFAAAERGEASLAAWMAAHAEPFRHVGAAELGAALGGLAPPVDRAALDAGAAEELAASMRRGLAAGFEGWIDDDLAFLRPWGVPLGAIGAPVTLWQGEEDTMVPPAHGAWLAAAIPGARLRPAPGEGHISILAARHDAILDGLLGGG